jgi:hypothetical protein
MWYGYSNLSIILLTPPPEDVDPTIYHLLWSLSRYSTQELVVK